MHRPLTRIKRALHPGAPDQLLAHPAHRSAGRCERRTGAPAHNNTLTSSALRQTHRADRANEPPDLSRVSPNSGVMCHPAICNMRASAKPTPRRSEVAPPRHPPTPQALPPFAAGDRPRPTATGRRAVVPADRSGRHAPAGDDDANRSSSRYPDPPIHRRAQPSRAPPTEPNPPRAPRAEACRERRRPWSRRCQLRLLVLTEAAVRLQRV